MKFFLFDVSNKKIFHVFEQPTTLAYCCLTASTIFFLPIIGRPKISALS
jgi:uncharacterized membrane protein